MLKKKKKEIVCETSDELQLSRSQPRCKASNSPAAPDELVFRYPTTGMREIRRAEYIYTVRMYVCIYDIEPLKQRN